MKQQEIPVFIPIKVKGRTSFHKPVEYSKPTKEFPRGQYTCDEEGYTYFDQNKQPIIFGWGVK